MVIVILRALVRSFRHLEAEHSATARVEQLGEEAVVVPQAEIIQAATPVAPPLAMVVDTQEATPVVVLEAIQGEGTAGVSRAVTLTVTSNSTKKLIAVPVNGGGVDPAPELATKFENTTEEEKLRVLLQSPRGKEQWMGIQRWLISEDHRTDFW